MKKILLFITICLLFNSQFIAQEFDKIEVVQIQQGVDDRPQLPDQISSTHFIVHYDHTEITLSYAEDVLNGAEYAYQRQCVDMGWQVPPHDNNRGGDNRYDIYITDIGGSRGVTYPEELPNWNEEWAPSYIAISNSLNLTEDRLMVVAHEFAHAIQLGYTYKDSHWFYENMAVYIAELCYNWQYEDYQNFLGKYPPHDPLNNMDVRIDYHSSPAGTNSRYQYAGFLWPQFLHEWTNDDQILIKIWERMGNNPGDNIFEDINTVLQTRHGLSLKDAFRNYAEWRYFTGVRDDGTHFHNASDYPTSIVSTGLGNYSFDLTGPGGTTLIELPSYGADLFEINVNGDDDADFDVSGIRLISEDSHIVQTEIIEINLDLNQEGSGLVLNSELVLISTIIESVTGYKSIDSKNVEITVIESELAAVYFKNHYEALDIGGSLKLNNNDIVTSGDYRVLEDESINTIETLLERTMMGANLLKHNHWNNSLANYYLLNNFTARTGGNSNQTAFSAVLVPVKVNLTIDGSQIELGKIKFNDPWYLKSDGTQSGMNDFIEFDAPYEPTGKDGETNGGVFLNQNPNFVPDVPGYKVSISPRQTINYNNRDHKIYFNNWSDNGKADFQNAELATTPVVFTDGGAEVYANHKGSLLSNTQYAFNGPSQRKIARTSDGYYHLVYESMGRVWYETKHL